MKKTLRPRTIKDIKGKMAIAELRRAHYIITVLSLAFIFILVVNMLMPLEFDVVLGTIASVLLFVVALSSFVTALALRSK